MGYRAKKPEYRFKVGEAVRIVNDRNRWYQYEDIDRRFTCVVEDRRVDEAWGVQYTLNYQDSGDEVGWWFCEDDLDWAMKAPTKKELKAAEKSILRSLGVK